MMPLQENQAEPSMEEILASIRRIISEDDKGGSAPAAPEPVLELSTPAPPPAPAPAPAPEPPMSLMREKSDLLVFDEEEEPAPSYAPPPRSSYDAPPPPRAETIVSEPVVSAAAHSFTRLAGTLRLTEVQGQTLEGLVRELLRPMLRDWLDENLPAIVEAMVEAELDRISRLAR